MAESSAAGGDLARRDVLRAAAAAPLLDVLRRVPRQGPPPTNLLVLVSDDQSRFDLGAYGNADCTTPHLDRLAAEGALFHKAFTQVSICRPSRTSLLTGLEAHRHGATGFQYIDEDVRTWPELLNPACATALIGKLGVAPAERLPFAFLRRAAGPSWRRPEMYAGALREFLASRDAAFAAVVSFVDPHRPFWEDWDEGPPEPHDPTALQVPPYLLQSFETGEELAKYYDAIRRLDAGVGAVLGELEAAGHADDTLVLFTSDNGAPFPFAKTTLYEAGIGVPLLARWPGVVEPGFESDALVSLVDLLPTALELFGVSPPDELQGHSLLALLRGEAASARERLFLEHDEHRAGHAYPMRGVRTARFKYIRNLRPELTFENSITGFANDDSSRPSATWQSWLRKAPSRKRIANRVEAFQHRPREELYDLVDDPWERKNLAADDAHAAQLRRLRADVRAWMERDGDPLLAEWGD
jgi:arylsulfatase A-like enzyme